METLFKVIFVLFFISTFFYLERRKKHKKQTEIEKYKDSQKDNLGYQFLNNNADFKHTAFTEQEVKKLSSLMGVVIPQPDPLKLRSYLGTTLDKKQIPILAYHHLCVKMHKYLWKGKELILFDIELHGGPPVMKGNELTHPFYKGEISVWVELFSLENGWNKIIKRCCA